MTIDMEVSAELYGGLDIEGPSERIQERAARRHIELWADELERHGFVASGELLRSLTVQQDADGTWEAFSDVIQAWVAENGRPPTPGSPPPFDPIAKWARDVGLFPEADQTFEEMVDAIRWSIARTGIEGFHPGMRSFNQVERESIRELTNEFDEQVQDLAVD